MWNKLPAKQETSLRSLNMEDLFNEARKHGRVHIFTGQHGGYNAWIEFETIPGTKLEAKSEFGLQTVNLALADAIEKAKLIKESFK